MIDEKDTFKIDPPDFHVKEEYNLQYCLEGLLHQVNFSFGSKNYELEKEHLVHFCMGLLCGLKERKKE